MDFATASIDYWRGRGLPREKMVLGLPFYSRPGELPYRKLVQADPSAANRDFTLYEGVQQNYNGIPTIQAKTRLARARATGVMFWEIEDDSNDDLSLLSAIRRTVDAFPTTPAGKDQPDNHGSAGR